MRLLNIAIIITIFAAPAFGKGQPRYAAAPDLTQAKEDQGPRARHWSGFDIGTGAVPFPSVFGAMIGFNVEDDARISIGTGSLVRWTTYQLDAKVFLAPTAWAVYIGGGLDYLTGKAGTFIYDLQFDKSLVPYVEAGIDFQSEVGVHVGFNFGFAAPNGRIMALPGLALGWYF